MGQGFWCGVCMFCVGNGSRVVVVQVAFVFQILATRVPDGPYGVRGPLGTRVAQIRKRMAPWDRHTGPNTTNKQTLHANTTGPEKKKRGKIEGKGHFVLTRCPT
jgi:hypothetical protein